MSVGWRAGAKLMSSWSSARFFRRSEPCSVGNRPPRCRCVAAMALYLDADATLDDLREAVTTSEDAERTARRVLGGEHPVTTGMEKSLQSARTVLRARETPSPR